MDGRVVERILGVRDAEETCTLLEGRGSETRHLLQLGAGGESPILLPVIHNVLSKRRTQSADIHQQMLGGRVEIHTNEVYTTLYRLVEGVFELCLIHIVLILSHTDALGIDLHQFGEGIHETATYRDSTTNGDILIRELIAGYLRGGIDGGPILADGKDLGLGGLCLLLGIDIITTRQHILDEVVGLTTGGTIADGEFTGGWGKMAS